MPVLEVLSIGFESVAVGPPMQTIMVIVIDVKLLMRTVAPVLPYSRGCYLRALFV